MKILETKKMQCCKFLKEREEEKNFLSNPKTRILKQESLQKMLKQQLTKTNENKMQEKH
jgi:hypothetical protein